jgi:hypothetical protein
MIKEECIYCGREVEGNGHMCAECRKEDAEDRERTYIE